MPNPHILQKTLVDITKSAKFSLENLYAGAKPSDADDVWIRYHTGRGILALWGEIALDMGVAEVINVQAQNELEKMLADFDNAARARIGMPPVV